MIQYKFHAGFFQAWYWAESGIGQHLQSHTMALEYLPLLHLQMSLFNPAPLSRYNISGGGAPGGPYGITIAQQGKPGQQPLQASVMPVGPDDFTFRVASQQLDVRTPLGLVRESTSGAAGPDGAGGDRRVSFAPQTPEHTQYY